MIKLAEVEINLKFVKLKFKVGELEDIFGSFLNEMREITSKIDTAQLKTLTDIMNAPHPI